MMIRWLIALCFLFSVVAHAEEKKHAWQVIYRGDLQTPSIFIDLASIQKQGRLNAFSAMSQLPPTLRIRTYKSDDSAAEVNLPELAAAVVFYMAIDCQFQKYVPYRTDLYSEKGKLIYSYTFNENVEPIIIDPEDDVSVMYKFFCGKDVTEKQKL